MKFRTSPSQGSISERVRIEQNGQIGVGGISPRTINSHAPQIQISGNNYSDATVSIINNANDSNEGDLLNILNPLIKSESVWKSHALYIMAEFFYSKNEMQKSKEFFNQILNLENANQEIQLEARKRLNRDLSE